MPSPERVLAELSSVSSMDDFFGKEGIFARLFAQTMEAMLRLGGVLVTADDDFVQRQNWRYSTSP